MTTESNTEPGELFQKVLAHLHRRGAWGYWHILPRNQSFWWKVGEPAALPTTPNQNIYFGIHPVNVIPPANKHGEVKAPEWVRSQIDFVSAINCVFAELDAKEERFGGDLKAVLQYVETYDPRPGMVIVSGGGAHAYWLLREPFLIESDRDRERAKQLQADWVRMVGGDDAAKDLARILRVPATLNFKYQPPRKVWLRYVDWQCQYAIDELESLCAAHRSPVIVAPPSNGNGKAHVFDAGGARVNAIFETMARNLASTPAHQWHETILRYGDAAGGYVASGLIDQDTAFETLFNATRARADVKDSERALRDAIEHGKQSPITLDDDLFHVLDADGELPAPASPTHPRPAQNGGAVWLVVGDILDAFGKAETGDAELLAKLYADRVVYDHAEGAWYLWNKHNWQRDKTREIERLVTHAVAAQYLHAAAELKKQANGEDSEKRIKELHQRASALRYRNRIANVLHRAAAERGLALRGDEWDGDRMLLAVANGVVDLKSAMLRPGQPGDYIRTMAPVEWQGLDTPAPRWNQFLQEIFARDDDLIRFIQRWFGYCLTGAVYEDAFVVLHGESGRNGKRILTETIARNLGAYATVGDDDLLLDNRDRAAGAPKQFLVDIASKRLVLLSETKEGSRFNLARIKRLSGGDTMTARAIFGKQGIELTPTWKFVLSTNRMPHADADDDAFFERIFIVPFTQRFVVHPDPNKTNEHPRDPKLEQALLQEAPGILAWLVRGCLDWQRIGLNPPASVRAATKQYRDQEDELGNFIKDRCFVAPHARAKASELYNSYKDWAIAGNQKSIMTSNMFGRRMGKRYTRLDDLAHTYIGIGLLDSD